MLAMSIYATQLPPLPAKQQAVARAVRERIVSGQWRPGDRLPPRTELEQQFGVAGNTLQRALDRLAAEGFIHASTTAGTFVADHPPHSSQIGVVVPESGGVALRQNRFTQAMRVEAERLDRAQAPHHRYVLFPEHVDSSGIVDRAF